MPMRVTVGDSGLRCLSQSGTFSGTSDRFSFCPRTRDKDHIVTHALATHALATHALATHALLSLPEIPDSYVKQQAGPRKMTMDFC